MSEEEEAKKDKLELLANKRMVNTGLHALVFRLRVIPALPLLDAYHCEVLVTQNMLDVVGQCYATNNAFSVII